ncbi:rhomboid family intramembrane serine protease [bacterium]|nr:rhomboid family intramembrane serine protease [bacterium]MCI0607077.1 rhomboid family intramembrane serine protease [bacterium]
MLLIPYGHEDQVVRRRSWITYFLIGLNVLIFVTLSSSAPDEVEIDKAAQDMLRYYRDHPYLELPQNLLKLFDQESLKEVGEKDISGLTDQQIAEEQAVLDKKAENVWKMIEESPDFQYGHRPVKPHWWSFITSMFLHGNWEHLLGNMLFLYIAGCTIEDLWGKPLYLTFYLSGGILAAWTHDLKFPESEVPLIGASGAIAAIMGAFLVRLYNTRIKFFYLIGIWIRGTFLAPAWIALPLWLLIQFWSAATLGESAGVAFWAHIGGFLFGAVFGIAMNVLRFEEKFIDPYIEKKIGIVQDSRFLRAMELSQKSNYVQAKELLHQVIQSEPDHVEAYMELKRIALLNGNEEADRQYTANLLEALIRKRDVNLIWDIYSEYGRGTIRSKALPPKTLLGLAAFYEHLPDYRTSLEIYEKLIGIYPDDPLTIQALIKAGHLCMDKLDLKQRGIEFLSKAYSHPKVDSQWHAILKSDLQRYRIFITPKTPELDESIFDPHTIETPKDADFVLLPDPGFNQNSTTVSCWIERCTVEGMQLRNEKQEHGLLPWKQIRYISVGRIKNPSPTAPKAEKDYLVLDLVVPDPTNRGKYIHYRTFSYRFDFKKMFPGAPLTSGESYKKMIENILASSNATPMPDESKCLSGFATYRRLKEYENELKQQLGL